MSQLLSSYNAIPTNSCSYHKLTIILVVTIHQTRQPDEKAMGALWMTTLLLTALLYKAIILCVLISRNQFNHIPIY